MVFEHFKILTFDVVGTLIDFEGGMLGYLRQVGGPQLTQISDETILEAYARIRYRKGTGIRFPDALVDVYADLAREFNLPTDHGAAQGFRDSIRVWPAFPDSAEALRRLKGRFRLVAMTNAQRWSLEHMARTLGNPFHDSVTVDDVRAEKPDPQFFHFNRGRQSAHGYVLEDILHVAQSQYHDIGVAKRLGYRTCWIERRKGKKGFGGSPPPEQMTVPDFHFSTLAELADAVDREAEAAR
jgi:putative hydrolase of the HAD superfamily